MSAKHDINKNRCRIVLINQDYDIYIDEKKIANKYGFDITNTDINIFTNHYVKGFDIYNSLMKKEISRKLGAVNYKRYLCEMDSLQKEILKFIRP